MKKVCFALMLMILLLSGIARGDEWLPVLGSSYIDSGTLNKSGAILSFGYKTIPSEEYKRWLFDMYIKGLLSLDVATVEIMIKTAYELNFYRYDLKANKYSYVSSVSYDKSGHILEVKDYAKEAKNDDPVGKARYFFHELPSIEPVVEIVQTILTKYKAYIKEE